MGAGPNLAATVAAIHLTSVVLATAAYLVRAVALRGARTSPAHLAQALAADLWAGLLAFPLYGAGLWRLFGGLEKPLDWYTAHPLFWTKLGLITCLMVLELPVQVALFPLQVAKSRRQPLVLTDARGRLAFGANVAGVALMCALVPVAALMARGVGRGETSRAHGGDACAVEAIFQARCVPCHATGQRLAGLDLVGAPVHSLAGRSSSQWPDEPLVSPGAPEASLLVRKLAGTQGSARGARMPLAGALEPAGVDTVARWVRDGARPCER
ncbi:MAG: DUF2214 family protein [Polyangiaceae bacterium]|nr:DUF2214 family protein [Polyangiaceae bacterium]